MAARRRAKKASKKRASKKKAAGKRTSRRESAAKKRSAKKKTARRKRKSRRVKKRPAASLGSATHEPPASVTGGFGHDRDAIAPRARMPVEVSRRRRSAQQRRSPALPLHSPGYMRETHGGGRLEAPPGFDPTNAMTEGFRPEQAKIRMSRSECRLIGDEIFSPPEGQCGDDDRVRIHATASVPWRSVCHLRIRTPSGGRFIGTGWFAGPHTIVTAGHNVYGHSTGGWASEIEVIPGQDGSTLPFGKACSSNFEATTAWVEDKDEELDLGAIFLDDPSLGNAVGWFGFAVRTEDELRNLIVQNAGYPGDKPAGSMWYNAGRVARVEPKRLFYMLDTKVGHSGGPVYWLDERGSDPVVVAVHNYGNCPNKGTRITPEIFDLMLRWKTDPPI